MDRQGDRLTANSGKNMDLFCMQGKATAGFQHSTDQRGLTSWEDHQLLCGMETTEGQSESQEASQEAAVVVQGPGGGKEVVRSGSIPYRSWKWNSLKTGMSEVWEKENQDKDRVFGLSNWKSVSSGGADWQEQLLR